MKMKLKFRGWRREVNTHKHEITPVDFVNNRYAVSGKPGSYLRWHSPTKALAKIYNLSLSGNFLIEIDFSINELKNWISCLIEKDPERAFRLLSEFQAEAFSARKEKNK